MMFDLRNEIVLMQKELTLLTNDGQQIFVPVVRY